MHLLTWPAPEATVYWVILTKTTVGLTLWQRKITGKIYRGSRCRWPFLQRWGESRTSHGQAYQTDTRHRGRIPQTPRPCSAEAVSWTQRSRIRTCAPICCRRYVSPQTTEYNFLFNPRKAALANAWCGACLRAENFVCIYVVCIYTWLFACQIRCFHAQSDGAWMRFCYCHSCVSDAFHGLARHIYIMCKRSVSNIQLRW